MQPIDAEDLRPRPGSAETVTPSPGQPHRRRRRARSFALKLGIVLVLFVLLGVAATYAWREGHAEALAFRARDGTAHIARNLGLAVEEVYVSGRVEANKEDVRRALAIAPGQSILDVDLSAARARLVALGWVASATVSRSLPRAIHVRLMERQPYALWQRDGKLALIDRDGALITTKRLGRFSHLPLVVGPGAASHAADILDLLGEEPQLERRVAAMVWVAGRRWNLKFDNGIEVKLPERDAAEAWHRLARLEAEHRILGRDLVAIDLRLPDRLIVRMTPAAAAQRGPGEET